jgi:two-component system, OmpR family, alkaline phosphatase synthesis response regulator PhoP
MPKILVVDDGETIRDLISDILTNARYDIVTAKDGEEGLKIFNESYFDLVITDLMMPKCDGNETAKNISNAKRNITVAGIISTPGDFDQNYFYVIIENPFSLEEFTKCIKSIIQDDKSV